MFLTFLMDPCLYSYSMLELANRKYIYTIIPSGAQSNFSLHTVKFLLLPHLPCKLSQPLRGLT